MPPLSIAVFCPHLPARSVFVPQALFLFRPPPLAWATVGRTVYAKVITNDFPCIKAGPPLFGGLR